MTIQYQSLPLSANEPTCVLLLQLAETRQALATAKQRVQELDAELTRLREQVGRCLIHCL